MFGCGKPVMFDMAGSDWFNEEILDPLSRFKSHHNRKFPNRPNLSELVILILFHWMRH